MQLEEKIIEKAGKETPFRVPEGYFESFSARMMSQLPEYPAAPRAKRLGTWQRVRPYVYMAAMFAGIWCMMKVFHTATAQQGGFDNPPESVTLAMNDAATYEFYTDETSASDFGLEEDVCAMYTSFDDFEKDFNSI